MRKPRGFFIAVALAVCGALLVAPTASAKKKPGDPGDINPVIFVHGGAGSGAQFESQQMRFTSNGYPQRYIRVLEYDSTFGTNTMAQIHAKLDQLIADLQQETGEAKVDVLGHSLGTTVMHQYLNSSPARAANVAHYVNIDGMQSASPPGGVPTLAIWAGRGTPGRSIGGATNVTVPNQTHVQSATSKESFVEMFKFFTGHDPETSDISAEAPGRVSIAGRAVIFPQNSGAPDTTLRVWKVHGSTGQRKGNKPVEKAEIAADGSFGPFDKIKGGKHYEFALSREGARAGHFYFEPFRRSDHLVRLLTVNPGTGSDALVEKSDNHVSLVAVRNKEMWGDQGAENDVLELNGVNVLNAATAPINKRVIGMFAYDVGSDGVTNLSAPIPAFFALPFQSGVDVFMPASADGDGTVSVGLQSRGSGPVRTINVPNRPSTTDMNFVGFNDFE
jgi:pimeloyl-ACP methyl ester carboxylesterase